MTRGLTPSNRLGSPRSSRSSSDGGGWAMSGRCRRPRRGRRSWPCTPSATSRWCSAPRSAGGRRSTPTRSSRRARSRRLCTPPGRGGARRPAARRRGADRLQRPPPARPSRRAQPRDGLLPVQQHRRRGAPCGGRPRVRAGDDRRLGRAPRQRHQRRVPRRSAGAVCVDPPVAAVSGHRAGRRRRLGSRPWVHRQPPGGRRVRATTDYVSLVSRRGDPPRARSSRPS